MSFRFLFSFFVMYMMADNAFPLIGELGFLDWMTELNQFVVWLGRHVLDVEQEISTESTGSGDTTFFYLQLYFFLVAAVFAASVWSILDRDRKEYNALHYWLMIGLRYYLAIHLWSYGFEKVYKLQFPTPSLERLVQPYGESTPMGLAWTFMGYSKLYNYFTGFAEVLGGALLLFRRTATLGALVSLLVMLNVAVMNFSFDIPVKLFSTTLAVMCLYLLRQQIKVLYSFFIDHRLTKLTLFPVPFSQNKPLKTTSRILKYSWIGYELFNNISENRRWDIEQGDNAPKPPLYGIYYTENFVRNNDTLPPLATDSLYWKRMIVTEYGYASEKTNRGNLLRRQRRKAFAPIRTHW